MKLGKGLMATGAMATVLLMILGGFAVPTYASAAPVTTGDQITTETGTTTDLGGGDYFLVKFGTDAAYGLIWGTEANENNIYMVAIMTRYLGMAQVYDMQGNVVAQNETIKVFTIYAVKLSDLIEFSDTTGDGLLQYQRVYDGGNYTGDYAAAEPIYKMADLNTSWIQSPVTYEETDSTKIWTFSLTALDLPYEPLANYTGPTGDDKLNNITLTFHLSANLVQVDNATLPQWRITVQQGMMGNLYWFNDIQRMDDYRVSGKVFKYNVKWDQSIEGWDYDAADTNPALLMEFEAIVGNYIPSGGATWMVMNMVRAMHENGHMVCNEGTSSEIQMDQDTGTLTQARTLTQNRLTFGGERTRIGALSWVSNVTVDGHEEQLHAQIMAGVPVWARAMNGAAFAGFAVLGGIAFPGGGLIVHDPTFSAETLLDISSSTKTFPTGLMLMGAAAAVIVLVVIAALVLMSGKKPGQKVQQSYERTMSSQPGEWAKYYNKK